MQLILRRQVLRATHIQHIGYQAVISCGLVSVCTFYYLSVTRQRIENSSDLE